MNIGILAQLKQSKVTGINRVTLGTLSELLKQDVHSHYYYIGNTEWLPIRLDTIDALYNSAGPILLNFAVTAHPLDIVHSHYRPFKLSKRIRCGKILTVHDLIPYLHPEWNNNQYDYFDGPIRKCAQEADVVIAVSECTKRDLVEQFHIPDEKIKVVYSGLYPDQFFTADDNGKAIAGLDVGKFIVMVSAVGANKNHAGLIRAYLQFRLHHPESDIKLVVTGPIRQYQVIREVLEQYSDLAGNVVFTGFVTDEELVWLYRSAEAFAYVSFYEGFGLPILEALSVGKAVICSETSSMPEVGGEAVQYCNPYDVDSIESAIEQVVLNDDRRKELEKMAMAQASKFSYENTARETLEIYRLFEG